MAAPGLLSLPLDVVIFGGGASGLWLLSRLVDRGHRALLLEAGDLGAGQTVASQGILHGGFKYSLAGRRSASSAAVRDMPARWRRCLAGEARPDLSRTRLRAASCHLWHTAGLRSRLAMLGARAGLRVRPVPVGAGDRPPPLAGCPGTVARLDEQVIEPASLIQVLAGPLRRRILGIDAGRGLGFDLQPGAVRTVTLAAPGEDAGQNLELRPRHVVLTAGEGNAGIRRRLGLPDGLMQRRPLRMVMLRGDLPVLNGHCVDGARTRVTVTTTRDSAGRAVWQVGGEIAEGGADRDEAALLALARRELEAVLPGVPFRGAAWASYRVDRAEGAAGGLRPDDVCVVAEGNVVTAWPTKLVLVPRLADRVLELLGDPVLGGPAEGAGPDSWPRPVVALPPWETRQRWFDDL